MCYSWNKEGKDRMTNGYTRCGCVCGLNRGLGGGGAENLFIEDTLKPILDNLHGLAV